MDSLVHLVVLSIAAVIVSGNTLGHPTRCGRYCEDPKGSGQFKCCDTDTLIKSLSTQQQTMNTNILTKLQDMEDKQDKEYLKIESKLDKIINLQEMTFASRCNEVNGFLTPSHDECFIYNQEARTWEAAEKYCSSLGMEMATPMHHNSLWLRKHIIDNYGHGDWNWLNGRGDNSAIVMDGEVIPESNPLWYNDNPTNPTNSGSGITTSHCLLLMTSSKYMNLQPDKPYHTYLCSATTTRTLCELV